MKLTLDQLTFIKACIDNATIKGSDAKFVLEVKEVVEKDLEKQIEVNKKMGVIK